MKKLLLTAAAMMVAVGVSAQGTINFANIAFGANAVDAPVFDTDGTTRLAGADFMAQLYFGPQGTAAGSLTADDAAPETFAAPGQGYFSAGSTRTLEGIAAGSVATVQVRAWDASGGATSWESAIFRGESITLDIATGGAGVPPSLPSNLVGLESFSLVPEPSTFALGLIGAGALFFARRRK